MSKSNSFGATTGSPVLRDFQHAARLFVDGDHQYAPKVKFLYHVVFSIKGGGVNTTLNMLVKTAELPGFTVETQTLNQYNRKKNVQVKHDYKPVTLKLHDDNSGVSRKLWEQYYNFYYADSAAAGRSGAYNRSATRAASYVRGPYGYIGPTDSFFSSITIYQMGGKQWNGFKLINPIISAWNHDMLDYSQSQPVEQTMTLLYEAVEYSSGTVSEDNPPGFATSHYDKTPSPYSQSSGPSGDPLSAAARSIAGTSIANTLSNSTLASAVSAATNSSNYYSQVATLGVGVAAQATNLAAAARELPQSINGIVSTTFPVKETVAKTVATAKNILGNA